MKDRKKIFFALLLFAIFNIFFIGKAYHVDDHFTITIAKAVSEHFICIPKVYQGSPIFSGVVCDNPLLLGYYYAPIFSLFGEKETWMHLFFLPFSLMAVISMYFLSKRFVGAGILAPLCLLITPAFVVMSQNIMLDIPLLAFFLFTLAAFIYGADRNDKRMLFFSVVLAGMCCLVKYSGILVILVMSVYLFTASKKRYLPFLLVPIFIFLLWCVHNLIFYNRIYFLVGVLLKAKEFSFNAISARIFACLSFISGTSVITIFLIPLLCRNKINFLLFVLSMPVGFSSFLAKSIFVGYSTIERLILALLFTASFFLILIICKTSLVVILKKSQDKDSLFLSLWFIFILIFTVGIQFIAARFILLLFPPMFLLVAKELNLNNRLFSLTRQDRFIFIAVLSTMVASLTVAIGDYRLAGVYRDFVTSLKEKLPIEKGLYFCPTSYDANLCYGYAYYLNKYYPQGRNKSIEKGVRGPEDILYIMPNGQFLAPSFYEACLDDPLKHSYKTTLFKSFNYYCNVFIHNRKFHAGFYSHDWGFLPFYISFKKKALETFDIYQISYE